MNYEFLEFLVRKAIENGDEEALERVHAAISAEVNRCRELKHRIQAALDPIRERKQRASAGPPHLTQQFTIGG